MREIINLVDSPKRGGKRKEVTLSRENEERQSRLKQEHRASVVADVDAILQNNNDEEGAQIAQD